MKLSLRLVKKFDWWVVVSHVYTTVANHLLINTRDIRIATPEPEPTRPWQRWSVSEQREQLARE